jgi:hypothetical protein
MEKYEADHYGFLQGHGGKGNRLGKGIFDTKIGYIILHGAKKTKKFAHEQPGWTYGDIVNILSATKQ